MPTLQADDPLTRPDDPERYWVLGGLITILADAALTDGRVGVTEQRMPAGAATPLHRHPQAETFLVRRTPSPSPSRDPSR